MAKTEVILTQNIVGLGAESDRIKVAPGYARNFLYPQRLAIPVTAANARRIEALRKRRVEREAHELNTMTELGRGLCKLTVLVKVKTGDDGKMFGAVTSGTIVDELKHQFDVALDKKKIHIAHPIRTLGEHEVELRLHAEVNTHLKVRVESTTPVPAAEEKPAAAGKAEAKGTPGARSERGARHGTDRTHERPATAAARGASASREKEKR
jgi:large subunit ribosomal protein L9